MTTTSEKKRSLLPHFESNADENQSSSHKASRNSNKNSRPYQPLAIFGDHKRAVSSVSFAPSRLCKSTWAYNHRRLASALVASASADGTAKLWNVRVQESDENENDDDIDLENEGHFGKNSDPMNVEDEVPQASRKKKKSSLYSGSQGNSNNYHNIQLPHTFKALHPLSTCVGHSRGINDVCWNPSSPLLATASDDKTVRLWDAITSEAIVELRGHDNFVFCVDQYHNMVVSGSFDETVKIWDVRTGDCVCTLPAHSDPVTAVSINHVDGTTVASASHDGLVRLWDVGTGECLKTIYAAGNPPVSSVRYSPNGKYLLTNTLDSMMRLWPVVSVPTSTQTTVTGAGGDALAPTKVATKTSSSTAHWGGCVKLYSDHTQNNFVNTKYSVTAAFLHTGNVVVGSETGRAVVFDVQSMRVLQVLPHTTLLTGSSEAAPSSSETTDHAGSTDAGITQQSPPVDATTNTSSSNSGGGGTANNPLVPPVVLSVSAHDTLPLIATGSMAADRKIEFWSAL